MHLEHCAFWKVAISDAFAKGQSFKHGSLHLSASQILP